MVIIAVVTILCFLCNFCVVSVREIYVHKCEQNLLDVIDLLKYFKRSMLDVNITLLLGMSVRRLANSFTAILHFISASLKFLWSTISFIVFWLNWHITFGLIMC